MKSIFSKNTRGDTTGTAALLSHLQQNTKGRGQLVDAASAQRVIAMEGLGDSQQTTLSDALTNFLSILSTGNRGEKFTIAQEQAAEVAVVYGSNVRAYAGRQPISADALRSAASSSQIPTLVVPAYDGVDRIAMEAFDDRANSNAMVFSAAYNVQSAKQNEFGDAFFPPVTIGPDQVGFEVHIQQILAYSEVTRQASGALNVFNRKNIIRAIIDSTILAVDQTKLIPVYRSSGGNDSSANFVAGIAATTVTPPEGGATFQTKPLAIGKKFSILGISQTDASLAAGQFDQTDAVDSSARVGAVYLSLTATVGQDSVTEYFKFDTSNLPTSDFNAAVQGNTRLLTLRFQTKALKLSAATTTTAGATSALLDALTTSTVRLGVTITGEITQDLGDTVLQATPVTIEAVNDAAGADAMSGSLGTTAAALFTTCSIVGYDLITYRTDSNRRNRGKLLDTQQFKFLFTMPLLPPITALRPVTGQDGEDGNTLSKLVTATRVQTSNAAVTAILKAQETLQVNAKDADAEVIANNPTLFGPAALLVNPAYLEDAIDCSIDLDSLTSSARTADLQNLLINKIRDMGARLFVMSGYGPALEAMYEGKAPKITIIIGCDPILHRYLVLNGDTRLTGDQFDYKIVPTYDNRFVGKIIFSFGLETSFNSGVVNPLHFGNMGWRPELTLMLPMVRNGNQVMELTVQPSYRHVVNLPIMGYLTVTNVDLVIGGKVAINNNPV